MQVDIKLDPEFAALLSNLKKTYGEELAKLNGFADSQLSYTDFIDNFVAKNVADASIDGNANVATKDICSLLSEMSKPHMKLLSLSKIFSTIRKQWGKETADSWLIDEYTGRNYLHDSHSTSFYDYCYAHDLEKIANEGLYFLDGFNHEPPQHLETYTDFVGEYIAWVSNRTSGACGLPGYLVYSYYFWKKDCDNGFYMKSPAYYRDQEFQRIIYKMNQPYMRQNQSAFCNMSIFDHNYLIELFGGRQFPDGSYIIDSVEEIMEYQKRFMEVLGAVRAKNAMTFPVMTYSLLYQDGKFVDEDFAKWCCKHNMQWGDSNFATFSDVTSLSNCPLSYDTKILYWSERYNKFVISPINQVYDNNTKHKKDFVTVLSKGKRIRCRINRFAEPADYEIELANGISFKTTANHLNKVYGKDYVATKDLTTDDYLPFYNKPYTGTDNMSYEDGKLIGMFLGDGSYTNNKQGVVYSLNRETDKDDIEFIKDYCSKRYNAHFSMTYTKSCISGKKECVNVRVNSLAVAGLISQFVDGDSALTKELSMSAVNCSLDFRKGIIDGLYTTDGGNNNRIYTCSEAMKDSMLALFSSLGLVTRIMEDNREGRLSKHTCYVIRWYEPGVRKVLKNVYKIDDEFMWVKIASVRRTDKHTGNFSYCLEVLDDVEPVFMLANGVHTHNCRLLSDINKLGFFNSIGGTAMSVGSIKVDTINLARIAYENKDEASYLKALRANAVQTMKALHSIRHIIKRNIEKGLLPTHTKNAIDMKHQYNTVGIIGIYETLEKFGLIKKDDFGYVSYTDEGLAFADKILRTLSEEIDAFRESNNCDYLINVEQIPGERAAAVLMQKDKIFHPDEKYTLPLYGNQWIPLGVKTTLTEKARVSAVLDKSCNGGAIGHFNIASPFKTFEDAWAALNAVAAAGCNYFAFNYRISVCKTNHSFFGETCPYCGEPKYATVQRIVGFLVPDRNYSKERKSESKLRTYFEW